MATSLCATLAARTASLPAPDWAIKHSSRRQRYAKYRIALANEDRRIRPAVRKDAYTGGDASPDRYGHNSGFTEASGSSIPRARRSDLINAPQNSQERRGCDPKLGPIQAMGKGTGVGTGTDMGHTRSAVAFQTIRVCITLAKRRH